MADSKVIDVIDKRSAGGLTKISVEGSSTQVGSPCEVILSKWSLEITMDLACLS